jgi:methanogenic corrinoid protein MtbC1
MSSFAGQLKKIRKERGLRQKDLAEALQVAQTTIANYEQGTRFPDENTLHKLADFFGVSFDVILGRAEGVSSVKTEQKAPTSLSPIVAQYIELVREHRMEELGQLIENEHKKRTVTEIYMRILQPALREVGRLWEIGEVDVSDEHYCSEVTQSLMSQLMRKIPRPREDCPVFIGFSVSGEQHKIGIQMVNDFLLLKGWRAIFLGDNLPAPSVLLEIQNHRVDVVGISATMPYHVNAVTSSIQTIRNAKLSHLPKIIVGGFVFNREPELWRQVGADGFAQDAERAADLIFNLVD